MLWLQDGEAHIAGALETFAALITNVPAFSFPLFSSCPRTRRRLDLLFTFAHAVSPSVVPPSPLPAWTSSRHRCGAISSLGPGFSELPQHSLLGNLISCLQLLTYSQELQTQVPAGPSGSRQRGMLWREGLQPFYKTSVSKSCSRPVGSLHSPPPPAPPGCSLWRVRQSSLHLLSIYYVSP